METITENKKSALTQVEGSNPIRYESTEVEEEIKEEC